MNRINDASAPRTASNDRSFANNTAPGAASSKERAPVGMAPVAGSKMAAPASSSRIAAPVTPTALAGAASAPATPQANEASPAPAPSTPPALTTSPEGSATASDSPAAASASEAAPSPTAAATATEADAASPAAQSAETEGQPATPDIPDAASAALNAVTEGSVAPADDVDFEGLDTEGLLAQSVAGTTQLGFAIAADDDANISRGQAVLAGVRNQLEADGATDSQLAEFDNNILISSTQFAFVASGDPRFDEDAIAASEGALSSGSLDAFRRTERTRTDRLAAAPLPLEGDIASAVDAVASGAIGPVDGVDFSLFNTAQLREQAASGAEDIAVGLTTEDADQLAEGQARIAGLRAQFAADGAGPNQLSEFDSAVTDFATQIALSETGAPEADQAALDDAFGFLLEGPVDAINRTNRERIDRGRERATDDIETAVTEAVETALSGAVPPLALEDFGSLSRGDIAGEAGSGIDFIGIGIAIGDDALVAEGQGRLAGARAQLEEDGLTPEDLAAFDASAVEFANLSARFQLGEDVSVSPLIEFTFGEPDFFDNADLGREIRQNRNPALTPEREAEIQVLIDEAIATSGDAAFEGGDLTLASVPQLAIQTRRAGDLISNGLTFDSASAIESGQNIFGAIRSELIENRSATEDEIALLDARLARAVQEQVLFNETPGTSGDLLSEARSDIDDVVEDAVTANVDFEDNFRLRDSVSFVGDNGAPEVSIFTNDIQERTGLTGGPDHQQAVENIIEEQLQDAGQSYTLTNLEIRGGSGLANSGSPEALLAVAEAAPDFLNRSLTLSVTPELLNDTLSALQAANSPLVEGLDLSEPVSQENFNDFRGVLRDFALDFENASEGVDLTPGEIGAWVLAAATISALESVAATGTDVFQGVPNSSTDFAAEQLASDEGLAGSITFVGNIGTLNSLESDEFFTSIDDFSGGDGILPDREDSFFRGEGVDVFAPGTAPFGISGTSFGTSFAAPDLLVTAALGRFNPNAETQA